VAEFLVVDTSVWIDAIHDRPMPRGFEEAVLAGIAIIPPLVVAELVSGANTVAERLGVGEVLQDSPVHDTSLAHWIDVGELRRHLAAKGVNVTLADAHIAQCALDLSALLLSRDAIFVAIARHTSLRLYG
jgi:predicted nucleic acid-binding protein